MTERLPRQQAQLTDLPVGFESFHPRKFISYQLNRAHALGYAHRRVFTEDEQADSHCKIGNLELAYAEVTTWLREHGRRSKPLSDTRSTALVAISRELSGHFHPTSIPLDNQKLRESTGNDRR